MDKPFVKLTIGLILGILLSFCFNIGLGFIYPILFLIIIIAILNIIKKRNNDINIFLIIILLGMILTNLNKNSKLLSLVDNRMDFTGRVIKVVYSNENEGKYMVNIITAGNYKVDEKIMLKVLDSGKLEVGDFFRFNGVLKIPMKNTNPKLFNYRLYLLTHKIHTTASIKDYSIYEIDKGEKSLYYKLTQRFTNDINGLFNQFLSPKNRDLMLSIILGNSNLLEEEELVLYRNLGLAHILAVSGLHIGIISGFLIFIFSRLGIKRKFNYIITLSIIWLYATLIGYSPSTLRACLMISILFLANLSHEPYDSLNTIFIAMFILLISNPFYLFSVSFQLSFIATISIIIITPRITQIFYPYKGKIINSLAGIIAVNIGLLPINAYYFNSLPLLGIIANLISIPILSISLIIGMLMIIFKYVFAIINPILGVILNILLNINSIVVNLLGDSPILNLNVFSPDLFTIICYYILLSIVIGLIKLDNMDIKIKKLLFYYLLMVVLVTSVSINLNESIEIHFIDVGQGDSILLNTRDSNYLIDTGGSFNDDFDIGKNITLPYLLKNGINTLDGIIITHFDSDHSQGLDALVNNIKVKSILASYIPKDSKYQMKIINDNNKIVLDRNTTLDIIWPNNAINIDNYNDNNKSLVLLLSYFDHKILFTGDIEKEVENQILDSRSQVDVLKVAHHGSKTSSTEDFLNKIRPKYSIISVGRNNFYNHPNQEVLERLLDINSTIYRTDEMGLIKIILNKNDINIITYMSDEIINEQTDNIFLLSIYSLYLLMCYVGIKSIYIKKESAKLELY